MCENGAGEGPTKEIRYCLQKNVYLHKAKASNDRDRWAALEVVAFIIKDEDCLLDSLLSLYL